MERRCVQRSGVEGLVAMVFYTLKGAGRCSGLYLMPGDSDADRLLRELRLER